MLTARMFLLDKQHAKKRFLLFICSLSFNVPEPRLSGAPTYRNQCPILIWTSIRGIFIGTMIYPNIFKVVAGHMVKAAPVGTWYVVG